MKRRWIQVLLMVAFGCLFTACGASTNFNQLWQDDDGVDSLMAKARAAYDAGEFDDAESYAEKVLEINDLNEEASVLLGYTYLSQGGIDPYRLARELISMSSSEGDSGSGSNLQPGGGSGGGGSGGGSGSSGGTGEKANDAASTLTQLSSLINLSDADYEKLGTTYEGDGTSTLFGDGGVTILVPNTVNDELRESVETLKYMNRAVKAVCRFVDDSTKELDESRYNADSCAAPEGVERTQTAKAHFLWAFSHLTEALVYQSVLLYSESSTSESTSNFQAASEDLNNFDGEFSDFAGRVTDLKNATDEVFATEVDEGTEGVTMINATLTNLETVEAAFAALAGLPDDISSTLTSSLDKIREVSESLGGDENSDTTALKGEMTKKFASVVSDKVDEAVEEELDRLGYSDVSSISDLEDAGATADQIEDFQSVCDSYDGLVEGVPSSDKDKPAFCE